MLTLNWDTATDTHGRKKEAVRKVIKDTAVAVTQEGLAEPPIRKGSKTIHFLLIVGGQWQHAAECFKALPNSQ